MYIKLHLILIMYLFLLISSLLLKQIRNDNVNNQPPIDQINHEIGDDRNSAENKLVPPKNNPNDNPSEDHSHHHHHYKLYQ